MKVLHLRSEHRCCVLFSFYAFEKTCRTQALPDLEPGDEMISFKEYARILLADVTVDLRAHCCLVVRGIFVSFAEIPHSVTGAPVLIYAA